MRRLGLIYYENVRKREPINLELLLFFLNNAVLCMSNFIYKFKADIIRQFLKTFHFKSVIEHFKFISLGLMINTCNLYLPPNTPS